MYRTSYFRRRRCRGMVGRSTFSPDPKVQTRLPSIFRSIYWSYQCSLSFYFPTLASLSSHPDPSRLLEEA